MTGEGGAYIAGALMGFGCAVGGAGITFGNATLIGLAIVLWGAQWLIWSGRMVKK